MVMEQRKHAILIANLFVSDVPAKQANMPPLVPIKMRSIIDDEVEGSDAKVKVEKVFLTSHDINGDWIDDFPLDYRRFVCREFPMLCADRQAVSRLMVAFVPDWGFAKLLDKNVRAITLKN